MCMCSMVLCFCCDMASTVIDDAHAQGVSERSELTPGHLSHPMCCCTAVRVCVCVCVGSTLATKVFIGDLQARKGGGSS